MSIILNGTTGITTPDVTAESYTGPLAVNASAPDNSVVVDASGNLQVATTSSTNGKITILKNSLYNSHSGHGLALLSYDNNAYTSMYMGADDTNDIGYIQTAQHNTGYARNLAINPNGGSLLVGTTSGVGKVRIQGGAGGIPAIYAYNTNATSGDYAAVFALGANTNNTSSFFLNCTQPGVANRFAIYGNGTYATISDRRLKKNVETARYGYLDDVNRLRVVKYNWVSQEDGEAKELGVIAQELEQVFPGLIQESQAEGADTAYKQIKASVLPFILLKAIQEQQELITAQQTALQEALGKIETLEARVAALEAA